MNGGLRLGSAPLCENGTMRAAIFALMGPAPSVRRTEMEDKRMFKTLFTAAMLTALVLGASLSIAASADAAEGKSTALTGDILRKAVTGKTVILRISGFDLPIRYAANGTMKGSMSMVAASLSGGGASDSGKWWIADDQLCQRWTSWMDAKTYCYSLSANGGAVRWVRSDGRSGTARIAG